MYGIFHRLFGGLGSAAWPLFWLCLVIGVNQLGWGIISPSLPLYADSFGVSEAAVGLTVSVYGLGRVLLALPSGHLADRWGRRSIMLTGTLVTSVGSLLCGAAQSFDQLLIFRLIAGAGAGMIMTGAHIILADITRPENRGRVMSIYQGWFLLAVGLGPAPGGVIAEWLGYRAPFFVFAALALAAGLIVHTRLAESRRSAGRPGQAAAGQAADQPVKAERAMGFRQVLAIPGIALAGLVMFSQSFSRTGAIFTIAPLDGHQRLGLTPSQIGWTFTLANLLMVVMVALAGPLSDRYGRKAVIVPSTLLSASAFLTFALAGNYTVYLLAGALWGMTGGLGGAAPAAYVADRAPRAAVGVALGTYRMLGDLGYLIGAALLGWISDQTGAGSALLVTAGLFLVIGAVFWIWAPEERRTAPPAPLPTRVT